MSEKESIDEEFALTDEQAAALHLSQNIAVTAGAGTGKTTTLTQRYLRMLEEDGVSPENIVTITFTKDAANEMRERIRAEVDTKLDEANSQSDYDRWRTIRDEIEDGYLHTIHGFCSRLLTEHAVEAPVDPNFAVLDETDAGVLQRDMVTRFIDERQDERDFKLLARLWKRHELETVLVGLLDSRPDSTEWAAYWGDASPDDYLDAAWEQFIPIDGVQVANWFEESALVDALQTLCDLYAKELEVDDGDNALTRVRQIDHILERTGALAPDASTRARQTAINDIANVLTTGNGDRYGNDWEYYGAASNGWGDFETEQAMLQDAIDTVLATIEPEVLPVIDDLSAERNSSYYVLALARVYSELEVAYAEAKTEQRALDYSDLIGETIEFLREHDAARTAVKSQFDYVMVDEVQDTDPRQWQLVQALTGTDPKEFDSRNVFLVGDEKQSIYRFRGADVTSFSAARERLNAANPPGTSAALPLSGNFRTVEPTLAFMNDLFESIFQPEGAERAPYEATPQALTARRTEGTEIDGQCEYLLVPESSGSGLLPASHPLETEQFINAAHREATALAARLSSMFVDPPTVYDEDEKEYRLATPDDVTILLRARTRLEFYERALDDADIPYTVVSGMGFYDTPEVTALLNLFRVFEDPTNDIPLYGVLRSPLFGFTDDQLASAFAVQVSDSLWEALRQADGDLEDAHTLISQWRQVAGLEGDAHTSISSWSSLLTRIIRETGYLASVSADDRPQQAVVNVEKLREQLRDWEDGHAFTISGLLRRIDHQRELATKTPEATIHTGADGVEIRTVHSAKGLESRIVVVPELNVRFNQRANVDEYGKVYLDQVDGIPFLGLKAPTESDTFVTADTLVRDRLKAHHQREDRAEQKRLLYVALTRARDHLLLSGTNKLAISGEHVFPKGSDPSSASSWRDFVEPVLFEDVELGELLTTPTLTSEFPTSQCQIRLPPAPVDWGGTESRSPTAPPSIETERPTRLEQPVRLSATDYAKYATGWKDDDVSDSWEPEAHRPSEDDDADDSYGKYAAAFGDAVHRICELDRPESEWSDIVKQSFTSRELDPSTVDMASVRAHAHSGRQTVKTLHSELESPAVYDELFVRAELDHGQVIGYIDHLAVTDDAYYVLDFKTSDTTDRRPEEIAERYWPQLEAYAVALDQHDTRQVHSMLCFTDADQLLRRTIEVAELRTIETKLDEALQSV